MAPPLPARKCDSHTYKKNAASRIAATFFVQIFCVLFLVMTQRREGNHIANAL